MRKKKNATAFDSDSDDVPSPRERKRERRDKKKEAEEISDSDSSSEEAAEKIEFKEDFLTAQRKAAIRAGQGKDKGDKEKKKKKKKKKAQTSDSDSDKEPKSTQKETPDGSNEDALRAKVALDTKALLEDVDEEEDEPVEFKPKKVKGRGERKFRSKGKDARDGE